MTARPKPEHFVQITAAGAAVAALAAAVLSWLDLRTAAAAALLCLLAVAFPGGALRVLRSIPGRLVLATTVLVSLMALGYEGKLHPVTTVACVLGAYILLVLTLEGRSPRELLSLRGAPEFFYGIGLGVLLCVVPLLFFPSFFESIDSSNAKTYLLGALLTGVCEEILFRGVLLRIFQDFLGSLLSLILSALLFATVHGAGQWLDTFLAGLALGACYLATGRLWLPIGGHLAHNFTLDLASGGNALRLEMMLYQSTVSSAFLIGLLLTITAVLLGYSHKKGRLVRPQWSKKSRPERPAV